MNPALLPSLKTAGCVFSGGFNWQGGKLTPNKKVWKTCFEDAIWPRE